MGYGKVNPERMREGMGQGSIAVAESQSRNSRGVLHLLSSHEVIAVLAGLREPIKAHLYCLQTEAVAEIGLLSGGVPVKGVAQHVLTGTRS